jgi:hypothetical protein
MHHNWALEKWNARCCCCNTHYCRAVEAKCMLTVLLPLLLMSQVRLYRRYWLVCHQAPARPGRQPAHIEAGAQWVQRSVGQCASGAWCLNAQSPMLERTWNPHHRRLWHHSYHHPRARQISCDAGLVVVAVLGGQAQAFFWPNGPLPARGTAAALALFPRRVQRAAVPNPVALVMPTGMLPLGWGKLFPALRELHIQGNDLFSRVEGAQTAGARAATSVAVPAALPSAWTSERIPVPFSKLIKLVLKPGNDYICSLPDYSDGGSGYMDVNLGEHSFAANCSLSELSLAHAAAAALA